MKYFIILLYSILFIWSSYVSAAEFERLVTSCNVCHGEGGVSINDLWPNLRGQKKSYFIKQMKDYQSGLRKDPLMSPQAMNLTDEQIEKLAEYFSKLE